jgi:hypothetical protein
MSELPPVQSLSISSASPKDEVRVSFEPPEQLGKFNFVSKTNAPTVNILLHALVEGKTLPGGDKLSEEDLRNAIKNREVTTPDLALCMYLGAPFTKFLQGKT